MFVYTMTKGMNRGILSRDYVAPALKGYQGIIDRLIKNDDKGQVTLTQCCSVAGLGYGRDGSYAYYLQGTGRGQRPQGRRAVHPRRHRAAAAARPAADRKAPRQTRRAASRRAGEGRPSRRSGRRSLRSWPGSRRRCFPAGSFRSWTSARRPTAQTDCTEAIAQGHCGLRAGGRRPRGRAAGRVSHRARSS